MNDARALTRTEPQPHGGLPIIAMRSFDGRVGGTLLMQLLGTSEAVVIDRVYPFENRYLTYLVHFARQLGTAAEPSRHWTMQDMLRDTFSNELAKGGPLPFEPLSIDRADFERRALAGLWVAFSDAA
ncbi:MAG: hypothetical protein JOZ75_00415, partial [Candidatus Dormibacteraeota bacterium]|nr:hypothetical protein [Candidatus Dormibacteraeota bacterium]